VLLVEDNPVNQQVAAGLLGKLGLDTEIAENGQKALDMEAARGPYDVILMDLEMPVMDGFEATRALRARGVKTPIIALTAHALRGYRERCLEAGMDQFLTKPLNFEDLRAALAQP
jgi:CheY-like chemotaxis protein